MQPIARQVGPAGRLERAPIDCAHQARRGERAGMTHDLVLVVDFGAQYAQLIARRIREARVYSEIVPHTMTVAEMVEREPAAIVLSGGPSSVYAEGAPAIDRAVFETGIPVFGMCYGFQLMAQGSGWRGRAHGGPRIRPYAGHGHRERDAAGRRTFRAHGLDVPRRHGHPGTRRLLGARRHGGNPGGGVRAPRDPSGRRPVASRGAAHRARPARTRALPARHRRLPPHVDDGQHRRGADRPDPRTDRHRRQGHLWSLRRCRLGGCGRHRAAGHRRPAHLRVRRPRPDAQGRDRTGRA